MNIKIPDYQVNELIYENYKTLIYKGVFCINNEPVIIKILKSEYPTFSELVRFRNQYTLVKNLDFSGIVIPKALKSCNNSYVLIMKDEGLISLKNYFDFLVKKNDFRTVLIDFLERSIDITNILYFLYQNKIIHKDIKPSNILINPATKKVKLSDFSLSSLLHKEKQFLTEVNVLEGTLGYISPEQTGRMNRGIDYRTDFYSLGVSFYELLTRNLPFITDDLAELVHSHIIEVPILPQKVNTQIPEILGNLILKLMNKSPDDRYQNPLGLKYDLEKIKQNVLVNKQKILFNLGTKDIHDSFIISEKIYGRQEEISMILEAFERVSQLFSKDNNKNVQLMLVSGYSGVGKTAVVNEVQKPILRKKGYFIKGKYDQFQRNIPFSALVNSFRDLIKQLLTQSRENIAQWKNKILEVLGNNGQIIIDVIPELELIIGKQLPVKKLSGNASKNRFNLLFKNFIKLFAIKEHPLVIFLDDLQWVDLASLNLIEVIISELNEEDDSNASLLLIGAYRDNEVQETHPLMLSLEEIKEKKIVVNEIKIFPLQKDDLNLLISDTLSCTLDIAFPLTELIYQKTKGNPFFATQFLKTLHEDGYIYFNFPIKAESQGGWQCDIAKIQQLSLTDNVVEFMSLQLKKLPLVTQNFLKLAACIGNEFDLETLAVISETSIEKTGKYLWKALTEEFIISD